MSINTVILKENHIEYIKNGQIPFELSGDGTEVLKYSTQSSRHSLSITLPQGLPTNINAADGYIYLTNKRFIFITDTQGDIISFLINLTFAGKIGFSHELKSPWFGANYWQFMFHSVDDPVISDGFPKNEWFQGKIQFNEGGLFRFIEIFNNVLNDAVNNTQIDEQLPSYSEI